MKSRDWFEVITGFKEAGHAETRRRLAVRDGRIVRLPDGQVLGSTGRFEAPSLAELRRRVSVDRGRRTEVGCMVGDIRALHQRAEFDGALFQVASQFNCLEMVGPHVTPEAGVTRYIDDRTQGPACAVAAGLGTIYRNYLVPVGEQVGQTSKRQLDNLEDLGRCLAELAGQPGLALWKMTNGYCDASAEQLRTINAVVQKASAGDIDTLRGALRIGVHHDVEVTDVDHGQRPMVTQAYCSALPVGYSRQAATEWQAFARLVLEASYEATLLAAAERAAGGQSRVVLLTRLGGGAFGNDDAWITDAVTRALGIVENAGLDVRMVSYGSMNPETARIARHWRGDATGGRAV